MTKLIWALTLQFCVLFSYKLCACHMQAAIIFSHYFTLLCSKYNWY